MTVVYSAVMCYLILVLVPFYAKCKRVPINIFLLLVLTNASSYVIGGLVVEYGK